MLVIWHEVELSVVAVTMELGSCTNLIPSFYSSMVFLSHDNGTSVNQLKFNEAHFFVNSNIYKYNIFCMYSRNDTLFLCSAS